MSSTEAKPIPSPMSEARLKVMQRRAAQGLPLAEAEDQPGVTAGIRSRTLGRYAKRSKEFNQGKARRVGHRGGSQATRDAKFDDDGEAIETWHPFAACDRYLATEIGSQAAAVALREWRHEMGR